MATIGGGDQITICMLNLMLYTQTIHPINTINDNKKRKVIENHTKRAGRSIQGIVETQIEILEVEIFSLFPHICFLYCALTVECPNQKFKNDWTIPPVKIKIQDESQSRNCTYMI